jgi:hypothetical protein
VFYRDLGYIFLSTWRGDIPPTRSTIYIVFLTGFFTTDHARYLTENEKLMGCSDPMNEALET